MPMRTQKQVCSNGVFSKAKIHAYHLKAKATKQPNFTLPYTYIRISKSIENQLELDDELKQTN